MQNKLLIFIALVIFFTLLIFSSFMYVLPEWEQAVITQFGEFKRVEKDAGLKFKLPVVETVNRFEKRILEWDGKPTQVPTLEKRYIWVDAFARWKIEDPLKYFQTLRTETSAHGKLDDIINSAVRNQISNNKLIESVRDTNREMLMKVDIQGERGTELGRVSKGRSVIEKQVFDEASVAVKEYGIELVDIRIKRINYTEQVREKVYERMIEERLRVAAKYRSEGEGEMMRVRGERENEEKRILSEAYRDSQQIKGKADAEAIKIYADAYSKDPDFFAFARTLDSYEKNLSKSSVLILSTNSEYLKYLVEFDEAGGAEENSKKAE